MKCGQELDTEEHGLKHYDDECKNALSECTKCELDFVRKDKDVHNCFKSLKRNFSQRFDRFEEIIKK